MNRLVTLALRGAIRAYQLSLSPLLGGNCRFAPTCSDYAREAIGRHGPIDGLALAFRRIARCHPFRPGGFDPVPDRIEPLPVVRAARVRGDAIQGRLTRRPG